MSETTVVEPLDTTTNAPSQPAVNLDPEHYVGIAASKLAKARYIGVYDGRDTLHELAQLYLDLAGILSELNPGAHHVASAVESLQSVDYYLDKKWKSEAEDQINRSKRWLRVVRVSGQARERTSVVNELRELRSDVSGSAEELVHVLDDGLNHIADAINRLADAVERPSRRRRLRRARQVPIDTDQPAGGAR